MSELENMLVVAVISFAVGIGFSYLWCVACAAMDHE